MGKRDDRVADRRRLAAMGDVGNERAVDLQPVDWERPEPGEIGVADSEIIYCDLHAARAQPVDLFDQEGIALDQRRLGDRKRSDERRVGKEGVRTCKTRWWPDH